MPSFSETLEMVLKVDPSTGISEIRRFASETEKSTGQAESSLKKFSSAALKIGAAGMGVGGFLTQMAAGDIQAAAQLKSAIENTGQSYSDFSGKIEEAAKQQVKFGHTDEEVNGALTKLTLATNDTQKALDDMQLVADLAARKNISLSDAAGLVAKVHGGSTKILKEFGIQVGLNADGTKNLDGALGQLAGKLTGQASAAADTWTGKLAALRAEIENHVSAFAQDYGPAILGASTVLSGLAGVTEVATTVIGKAAAAHAATTLAAQAMAAAEMEVVVAERAVTANSAATVASLYAVDAASVASSTAFGLWGLAVAGAVIAASTAIDLIGSKEKHTFTEVAKYASETGKELVQTFTFMKQEGNSDDLAKIFTLLASSGTTGIGVLQRYREELVLTGQSTAEVDGILSGAVAAQKNFSDATDTGTAVVKGSTKAVKDYADAVKNLNDTFKSMVDGTLSTFEAEIALNDAQIAARTSVEDLTKAQKDHKTTKDELTSATDKALTSIINEAKANESLYESQVKASGGTVDAATANSKLIEELYRVASTLDPKSPLRAQLGDYITQLQAVPGNVTTVANMDTSAAVQAVIDFQRALAGIPASVDTSYTWRGKVGANAAGTSNWRGGPTWVGERGPEIVNLPRGSQVIPNGRAMAMAGSPNSAMGGNGVTFAPVINVSALDARSAALAVGEALREFVRTYPVPAALKQAFQN